MDNKTILKYGPSAEAQWLQEAQKRGADVHPASGGSRCRIPSGIAAARHLGGLLLPALAHAGSRQTDASTAAKLDGSRHCRVRGTVHEPVAEALPSL